MAIYLDEQTRPYLTRILRGIKDTDFIGKRLQKMLQADLERLEEMRKCNHREGTYTGIKHCCVICGSFFKPGHGEEWDIAPDKEPEPTA